LVIPVKTDKIKNWCQASVFRYSLFLVSIFLNLKG
jgi:hypothetical protein